MHLPTGMTGATSEFTLPCFKLTTLTNRSYFHALLPRSDFNGHSECQGHSTGHPLTNRWPTGDIFQAPGSTWPVLITPVIGGDNGILPSLCLRNNVCDYCLVWLTSRRVVSYSALLTAQWSLLAGFRPPHWGFNIHTMTTGKQTRLVETLIPIFQSIPLLHNLDGIYNLDRI